jgi:hypothetical protein
VHVYLPMTLTGLRAVLDDKLVAPAPLDGYAITAGLRASLPGEDDEELEYAASNRAADASLLRLVGDPQAASLRVVLVVDVDESAADDHDGLDVGAVVLRDEIPFARVMSALVDDPAAASDVARVLAEPGDAAARSDLEDHQLLWYATQELPEVVAQT